MSSLFTSFARLFDFSAFPEQDRDDRYLAESTDIHDLERRMRQLDSGCQTHYAIGATGVFSH